ncbi:MAG: hypothetical protein LBM38_02520 [Clostridiales bacterium]|jgi:hypothetical protein|nr:hypothetical protein [Clostridiales bacterium]
MPLFKKKSETEKIIDKLAKEYSRPDKNYYEFSSQQEYLGNVFNELKQSIKNGTYETVLDNHLTEHYNVYNLGYTLLKNKLITMDSLLNKAINQEGNGTANPYNVIAMNILNNGARKQYVDTYLAFRADHPFLDAKTSELELFNIMFGFGKTSDDDIKNYFCNEAYTLHKCLEFLETPKLFDKIFGVKSFYSMCSFTRLLHILDLKPSTKTQILGKTLELLENWECGGDESFKPLFDEHKTQKIQNAKDVIRVAAPSILLTKEQRGSSKELIYIADAIEQINEANIKNVLIEHYQKDIEAKLGRKLELVPDASARKKLGEMSDSAASQGTNNAPSAAQNNGTPSYPGHLIIVN